MKILCVAEKPSIAKAVSSILAGGARLEIGNTQNKYIKNYKFNSRFPEWGDCEVVFTSVTGHLTEVDFGDAWRKWNSCQPASLLEAAQLIEKIPEVQMGHVWGADEGRGVRGFVIIS
jgi:DNA topoisomerase-3